MIEDAGRDFLWVFKVQQVSSTMARDSDEWNVLLIVGNRPFELFIDLRVAVFGCKQGRVTTGPCWSGFGIAPETCLLCFAHRLQATCVTLYLQKLFGVTREKVSIRFDDRVVAAEETVGVGDDAGLVELLVLIEETHALLRYLL